MKRLWENERYQKDGFRILNDLIWKAEVDFIHFWIYHMPVKAAQMKSAALKVSKCRQFW